MSTPCPAISRRTPASTMTRAAGRASGLRPTAESRSWTRTSWALAGPSRSMSLAPSSVALREVPAAWASRMSAQAVRFHPSEKS